ncbi:damage-inducible protein DinB [Adhaeribacter arboris]|uniref:Damage-inducible protein DinB n=1 Tax=Adhaeribacter arboris TaxID=2072846 RepID=A0A2T2YFY4_9BACT|nr:DinB family protein [Adhaeribacter arboris]PSR54421.1 damage-inducible protein DinB [Adhaeribacter arboris]
MKKSTLLLNVLFLVALMVTSKVSFAANPPAKSQMVADWQRAKAYTKEYLDAMPEAGSSFKPTPEMRSFAEQMLHLANANFNFASGASGTANPYQGKNLEKLDEYKTKAALSKVVLESYDFVISALNNTTDAQMASNVKLFNMDVNRGLAFEKAFEHQTHHRGQTTVYLRLKGVTPPGEKLF